MKSLVINILLVTMMVSCENKKKTTEQTIVSDSNATSVAAPATTRVVEKDLTTDTTVAVVPNKLKLALTSNALQLVNAETGSTREIAFGMPIDQLVDMINNVLQSKVSSISVNAECGAGPLNMATWNNGLSLVFQAAPTKNDWKFAGWFLGERSSPALTTMAGIGIGSTRAEMEEAYVIKTSNTSLGHEFSTASGLFGIFSGKTKDAKITNMWAGVSCNFR